MYIRVIVIILYVSKYPVHGNYKFALAKEERYVRTSGPAVS